MRRESAFPSTLGATVVLSVGGFLFWLLVARRFDDEVVGAGASLFSVSFFLVYVTNLGMPVLITRYAIDKSTHSANITAAAMIVTSLSGAAGAVIYVFVVSNQTLKSLGGQHLGAAALMVAVVVSVSISTIVDARLIASLQLRAYVGRVFAITVIRLLSILAIPRADNGRWLFLASVWAFGATGIVLIPSALRISCDNVGIGPKVPGLPTLVKFGLTNYLGQIAFQGPVFLTPVLVLISVSSAEYSDFYLAWGFASILLILLQMIGQTLLAEAGNYGYSSRRSALAVMVGVILSFAATLTTILSQHWFATTIYGAQYSGVGEILPWLMLGCAPVAVASVAVSEARYAEHNRSVLLTSVPFALLIAFGVAFGASAGGTRGASIGWFASSIATLIPSSRQLLLLNRNREMNHQPSTFGD